MRLATVLHRRQRQKQKAKPPKTQVFHQQLQRVGKHMLNRKCQRPSGAPNSTRLCLHSVADLHANMTLCSTLGFVGCIQLSQFYVPSLMSNVASYRSCIAQERQVMPWLQYGHGPTVVCRKRLHARRTYICACVYSSHMVMDICFW